MNGHSFTLIELIVVIAIIAILAAIIAPNAFRAIEKAKVAEFVSDLQAIKTATLAFYADTGFWPPNTGCGYCSCSFLASCGPHPSATGLDPFLGPPSFLWPTCGDGTPQGNGYTGWNGPYLEKWKRFLPWNGDSHCSNGIYEYDNWGSGIWVAGDCIPDAVEEKLKKMSDEGKFPFEIDDPTPDGTRGGGAGDLRVLIVKF